MQRRMRTDPDEPEMNIRERRVIDEEEAEIKVLRRNRSVLARNRILFGRDTLEQGEEK